MKLLLDENLPPAYRSRLAGHEVFTVAFMGWRGKKNGDLLALLADAGFDALLTMDRTMPHEQNLKRLRCAVIVLEAESNQLRDLDQLVPNLLATLKELVPCSVVRVRCRAS